jgi:hypothetical protein
MEPSAWQTTASEINSEGVLAMAKKSPKSSTPAVIAAAKASTPEVVSTTPVRNSAVPPKSAAIAAPPRKSPPATDAIRLRAYFIWQSNGGGEFENWIRAERELTSV